MDVAIIALISFVAGILNGVGASGGVVLMSALLSLGFSPVAATGINKFAGLAGSLGALANFLRNRNVLERSAFFMASACILGSIVGSFSALKVDSNFLGKLFAVLVAVVMCVTALKAYGRLNGWGPVGKFRHAVSIAVSSASGVYNGIFGPGTIILTSSQFQIFLGHEPVESLALSVFLNAISKLTTCIIFFIYLDDIRSVPLAVVAAAALTNIVGAHIGSSLSMRGGRTVKFLSFAAMVFLFCHLVFKYWL